MWIIFCEKKNNDDDNDIKDINLTEKYVTIYTADRNYVT